VQRQAVEDGVARPRPDVMSTYGVLAGGLLSRRCKPITSDIITPPPIAQQSIVMGMSVCLSAGASPGVHVQFSPNFGARYLWPWLDPRLVVFLYSTNKHRMFNVTVTAKILNAREN